jgi:hypothetical protein
MRPCSNSSLQTDFGKPRCADARPGSDFLHDSLARSLFAHRSSSPICDTAVISVPNDLRATMNPRRTDGCALRGRRRNDRRNLEAVPRQHDVGRRPADHVSADNWVCLRRRRSCPSRRCRTGCSPSPSTNRSPSQPRRRAPSRSGRRRPPTSCRASPGWRPSSSSSYRSPSAATAAPCEKRNQLEGLRRRRPPIRSR